MNLIRRHSNRVASALQANVRRRLSRKEYLVTRDAVCLIQIRIRGMLLRIRRRKTDFPALATSAPEAQSSTDEVPASKLTKRGMRLLRAYYGGRRARLLQRKGILSSLPDEPQESQARPGAATHRSAPIPVFSATRTAAGRAEWDESTITDASRASRAWYDSAW